METKVTKAMSQATVNYVHRFFQKYSIPRMSDEKIERILREHHAGRKHEPRVPIEQGKGKEVG
jgi:hypothetical protein